LGYLEGPPEGHHRPINASGNGSPFGGPFPIIGNSGHEEEDPTQSYSGLSHEKGQKGGRLVEGVKEGEEEEYAQQDPE